MKTRIFSSIKIFVFSGFMLWIFVFSSCTAGRKQAGYSIEKQDGQWVLLQDGDPLYIKGAVYLKRDTGRAVFHKIKKYGGNSVRLWRNFAVNLDSAQQNGLTALITLPLKGERNGMDWDDSVQVAKEKTRILKIVEEHRDHPAVMFWAIGNELDYIPPGIPYNRKLWDVINDLAGRIHEMDPDHPVMTVVGSGRFEQKVQEIARQCPNLDLLGINSYSNIGEITPLARKLWPKPYVITEWGPNGHWQMPHTEWNAAIEPNSTEKAEYYKNRYTKIIQADTTHCLGSYVFFWGTVQEITRTWWSMFDRSGRESQGVQVMRVLWGGSEPANHAPRIDSLIMEGKTALENVYLRPAEVNHAQVVYHEPVYHAHVVCHDPDQDELEFQWDIRPEVEPAPYAGIGEIPPEPIKGLILTQNREKVTFHAPEEPGACRLYLKILDHHGHFAVANFPFYVSGDR